MGTNIDDELYVAPKQNAKEENTFSHSKEANTFTDDIIGTKNEYHICREIFVFHWVSMSIFMHRKPCALLKEANKQKSPISQYFYNVATINVVKNANIYWTKDFLLHLRENSKKISDFESNIWFRFSQTDLIWFTLTQFSMSNNFLLKNIFFGRIRTSFQLNFTK